MSERNACSARDTIICIVCENCPHTRTAEYEVSHAAKLGRAASEDDAVVDHGPLDGRHLLASRISRWRFAWIAISNFFATVFTLGLARPWAAVRMARYLATATVLYSAGSLDDYLSTVKDTTGVVGAEYMDVEGLDFGF